MMDSPCCSGLRSVVTKLLIFPTIFFLPESAEVLLFAESGDLDLLLADDASVAVVDCALSPGAASSSPESHATVEPSVDGVDPEVLSG